MHLHHTANKERNNEVWIATCSADGKLIIHEVLIETSQQKQDREKILALATHHRDEVPSPENNPYSYSYSPSRSKPPSPSRSLSSIDWESDINREEIQNILNNPTKSKKKKKRKKLQIEINRLLSLPLDSSICFTLSFHKSCKYITTCIDCSCFVFEIDLNSRSPAYHEIKVAKDYLSGAQFIDDKHITISAPNNEKRRRSNDIVCFDHAKLHCLKQYFGETEKQMVVFATLKREICVYDITRIMDDAQFERRVGRIEGNMLQKMEGQFGGDILCISISDDGKFMVVGAEDNSYNIYSISVSIKKNHRYHHSVRIEWVLLSKRFVRLDQNINRVQWIDGRTLIASTDGGGELYLAAMYKIRECETVIDLLLRALRQSGVRTKCDTVEMHKYDTSEYVLRYIADIMLQYVMWIILDYTTNVDFDGRISCIATCPNVNDGAGLVVVGGFSNRLQGFVPLKK